MRLVDFVKIPSPSFFCSSDLFPLEELKGKEKKPITRLIKRTLAKINQVLYTRAKERPLWIPPIYLRSLHARQIGLNLNIMGVIGPSGIKTFTNISIVTIDPQRVKIALPLPAGRTLEKVTTSERMVQASPYLRFVCDEGTFSFGTTNPHKESPSVLVGDFSFHLGVF